MLTVSARIWFRLSFGTLPCVQSMVSRVAPCVSLITAFEQELGED